jgi:hypothetical protein
MSARNVVEVRTFKPPLLLIGADPQADKKKAAKVKVEITE